MNEWIFFWVDVVGIGAFALSGYLAAVKHRLDWLGIFLIAFLTALGGGILRDLMTDVVPYAFREVYPALTVVVVTVSALVFRLHRYGFDRHNLFIMTDAVGLSSFAITGVLAAWSAELNPIAVLLIALITAVGGGMIRDVLLNRVPTILTSGFYGSLAILIGLAMLLIDFVAAFNHFAALCVLVAAVTLRLIAVRHNWKLPVPQ